MISERLFEIYEAGEILQRFAEICRLFSSPIPDDDLSSVGDELIEILSELRKAKEFGKLIQFTNLLLDRQPVLYESEFPFIINDLIDYFCFHRNGEQVERFFNYYIEDPEKNFDLYLMCFQFILYYGYTDILRKAVSQNIEPIAMSEQYVPGTEYDLRICGITLFLEDYYRNNQEFDKTLFGKIKQYGLEPNEQYTNSFQQVFYGQIPDKEELIIELNKNLPDTLLMLYMMFMKYMFDRGMPFYTSDTIWNGILVTLPKKIKKKQTSSNFFVINQEDFEGFLVGATGGGIADYRIRLFAFLWGAFYYNDFLRSYELIDENVYSKNNKKLRHLKCKTIVSHLTLLWRFDFLHNWRKPDSVPEEEFNLEAVIFKKSHSLITSAWDALTVQIKDELASAPIFAAELEAAKIEIIEELGL